MINYISKQLKIDTRYIIREGFWMSVAQLASVASAFATTIVFANLLSENAFGTYRYLLGIGSVFAVLSLSGMSSSTLQATAKGIPGYVIQGIKIQLRYDSFAYLAGVSTALYYYTQSDAQLALGILIVTLLLPFHNSLQNIFSYLEGKKDYRLASLFHTLKTAAVTVATLITLFLTHNILVILLIYLGTQVLTNLCVFLYSRPTTVTNSNRLIDNKYLSYAKHTSIRNIISTISTKADTLLIFQNLGARELAIFSLANILPEQIKNQFKNLARLLVPKYVAYDKPHIIQKNILMRSVQLLCFSLFITAAYILFVPFLYRLFLPNYPEAIFLSQITALAFPAMIAIIPMSALQAQHRERELHAINSIGSIITLLLSFVLILSSGLLGASIAKVLSRYCFTILSFYFLYTTRNKT